MRQKASPKTPDARALALEVLAAALRRGESVEDLLAAAFRQHPWLPRRERALALELVQGVKRWEIRLDYLLGQMAARPLKKMHPLALNLLRLGAYQLLWLDKVPARAVLSEAGKLAKRKRLAPAQAGFINALLRRLAGGDIPPLPDAAGNPALFLSVSQAHPEWLARRWLARYGPEGAAAKMAANNLIPLLSIRVNTLKTDAASLTSRLAEEGATAAPCRLSPWGLHLTALKTAPLELPSFRQGLWLFQDEGAQLTTCLGGVARGWRVLESGCGRGGKTTRLAEEAGSRGLVLALDYHRGRLNEARGNLARWGGNNTLILQADGARPLPIKAHSLDAAVVDAPCSALGIIRRHPEIKTRLQETDLATFPPRQLAMLHEAAALVKPGGRLLYITCTTEPAENEEVVAAFRQSHPEFRLAPDPNLLPAPARSLIEPPGYFRTSPEAHGLDGFFAAAMISSEL